jgi:hypothetical protein
MAENPWGESTEKPGPLVVAFDLRPHLFSVASDAEGGIKDCARRYRTTALRSTTIRIAATTSAAQPNHEPPFLSWRLLDGHLREP